MIQYDIVTEDKNRGWIVNLVGTWFAGFSVIPHGGVYKGKREKALTIRIVAPGNARSVVDELAASIRSHNKQACVLVSETPATVRHV